MRTRFAFVFPGQGSQAVGMMTQLYADFPAINARFKVASEVLGFDLWRLVQQGPEHDLNQTHNTQPAMLVASISTWDAWLECGGPMPDLMAGHSFGEYSALVCAGALDFTEAVSLAADRGRYMQAAAANVEGAVVAVLGLEHAELAAICAQAADGEVVQCANINAPGQIVIAGHAQAVARAAELAKAAGAKKTVPLAVSVPVHTRLMEPAAERWLARLADCEIRAPEVPVIHNADVRTHDTPAAIGQALVDQLTAPVPWRGTIEYFVAHGVETMVECGPGRVLSTLIRRINRPTKTFALASRADIDTAREHIGEIDT